MLCMAWRDERSSAMGGWEV